MEQLTATVLDQNGAVMAGAAVTWVSSSSSVASVSTTGLVTAVADGTATVTATTGSASGTASVTVNAASGGLTFQSVSAGIFHSCGVTTAGEAYCWGIHGVGQLGDGIDTRSYVNVPVAVVGGLTFQSVNAGYHSCGVTTAGEAYCWGDNDYGQLGDGTGTDSNVPVAVVGGLTFQSVTAGQDHSCGVTTAGEAYCWGDNYYGQLGDGTFTDSNVPVRVGGS